MLVQVGVAGVLLVVLFVGLAYNGRAYWAWVLALGGALRFGERREAPRPGSSPPLPRSYLLTAAVFGLPPLRQARAWPPVPRRPFEHRGEAIAVRRRIGDPWVAKWRQS